MSKLSDLCKAYRVQDPKTYCEDDEFVSKLANCAVLMEDYLLSFVSWHNRECTHHYISEECLDEVNRILGEK